MRLRRALALAAVVGLPALASSPACAADEAIDLLLDVRADGVVAVTESVTFRAYAHDTRPAVALSIPLHALDGAPLRIDEVTATDAFRSAVRLEVTDRGNDLLARTTERLASDGQRGYRVTFAYRVEDALRAERGRHRLDWVVGIPRRGARDASLSVVVTFPPSLSRAATVQATILEALKPVPAAVTRTERGVDVTVAAVKPRDGVLLKLTWPSGHVARGVDDVPEPSWLPMLRPWTVPATGLVLFVVIAAVGRARRDAVIPVYVPPTILRAAEAGVVLDGRVKGADVVAAVADLALRGYLTLEPLREAGAEDVLIKVARPWHHDRDIRPFEAVMLAHVFGGESTVGLSSLRDGGEASRSIKENLAADLMERALFIDSPRSLARLGPVVALMVAAIWAQLAWNADAAWPTYAAGVLTGIVAWMFTALLEEDGLTADGRRARHELLGFREFLARVDRDRLDRLEPGTLDQNLPWAVALGVTRSWLRTRSAA